MRRYRALSRPPDAFCAGQSWADCITNTAGSDFRQGQALCGHDSGPFRSRPALSSSPPGLYCSECAGKADICTDLCLLQVTLLYHPLMGLAGAFDAVVELTSAIRKLANNFVSPLGCHPEGISTTELNLLADSKPVRRHTGLHRSGCRTPMPAQFPDQLAHEQPPTKRSRTGSFKSEPLRSTFLLAGGPH